MTSKEFLALSKQLDSLDIKTSVYANRLAVWNSDTDLGILLFDGNAYRVRHAFEGMTRSDVDKTEVMFGDKYFAVKHFFSLITKRTLLNIVIENDQ